MANYDQMRPDAELRIMLDARPTSRHARGLPVIVADDQVLAAVELRKKGSDLLHRAPGEITQVPDIVFRLNSFIPESDEVRVVIGD